MDCRSTAPQAVQEVGLEAAAPAAVAVAVLAPMRAAVALVAARAVVLRPSSQQLAAQAVLAAMPKPAIHAMGTVHLPFPCWETLFAAPHTRRSHLQRALLARYQLAPAALTAVVAAAQALRAPIQPRAKLRQRLRHSSAAAVRRCTTFSLP